jgi:hypothetical protein
MNWTREPDGTSVARFEGGRATVWRTRNVWNARVDAGRVGTMLFGFTDQQAAQAWAEQRVQELIRGDDERAV